jgi:type I restriction enzyme M protein
MSAQDSTRQRSELHKTIWAVANDLRGSVDGWDFKNYVLGFMFYRFVSENLANYINKLQHESGDIEFSYADLNDSEITEDIREFIVTSKGFFIMPSDLFTNVHAERESGNLNERLYATFTNIENSANNTVFETAIKGLFQDVDVNSNKLGGTVSERNTKLKQLLEKIATLDFGTEYKNNEIDAFGDAYEYLMAMYAANAGKSGGEFFTPQEVSELLTKITLIDRNEESGFKSSVNKVYDPACGSGSLLLKFAKILGKENVKDGFFGQEINLTTYNLARINMFLHDINPSKFDIKHGNTLIDPKHMEEKPFEAIVSNPPYSTKWEGDDNPILINDVRYAPAGKLAPKSKADLAFTMHMLNHLAPNGTAAIVEFPGVLYRGGAEKTIREYLIKENKIEAVIQLPANLFFGTTIATVILVLKNNKMTNNTLFIDASQEFVKVTKDNKITAENIKQILQWLSDRKEVEYRVAIVEKNKILENDANLSISSYVEAEDTSEKIDIDELNKELATTVANITRLREEIDEIVKGLG